MRIRTIFLAIIFVFVLTTSVFPENECLFYDLNADGSVNVLDMQEVKINLNCNPQEPECLYYDMNNDRVVNILDFQAVKTHLFCNPVTENQNVLKLECESSSVLKEGYVIVSLKVSDLIQPVVALQAIIGYDPTRISFFDFVPASPGWSNMIYWYCDDNGNIDLAVGIDLNIVGGTTKPCDILYLGFNVLQNASAGTTEVFFRQDVSDVEATFFSDENAQGVFPIKENGYFTIVP